MVGGGGGGLPHPRPMVCGYSITSLGGGGGIKAGWSPEYNWRLVPCFGVTCLCGPNSFLGPSGQWGADWRTQGQCSCQGGFGGGGSGEGGSDRLTLEERRGAGGSGTQVFMYQNWPGKTFPLIHRLCTGPTHCTRGNGKIWLGRFWDTAFWLPDPPYPPPPTDTQTHAASKAALNVSPSPPPPPPLLIPPPPPPRAGPDRPC